MDSDIETEMEELDDQDELASKVTYQGNSFGGYLHHQDEVVTMFGIDIENGSLLLNVLTSNVPDVATMQLIVIGDAPDTTEDSGGDEEFIDPGEDPEVEPMQGEYRIIDIKRNLTGTPFRTGLVISKHIGV